MTKYRTAIIACGTIARVHARGWLGVADQPTEIAAIADTNPDALREFGDFFHVPEAHRYADYREMLAKETDLDAVIIASPDFVHAEQTIACLKAGGWGWRAGSRSVSLPWRGPLCRVRRAHARR